MQALRKFSVTVDANPKNVEGTYTLDKAYPVIAIDLEEDNPNEIFLLVADDTGELYWLNWEQVRVASIDD